MKNETRSRGPAGGSERVLVCVIGQTRAHELTWTHFKRNVLDELNADLAVCVGVDGGYDYANPFWQHAKYRWPLREYADFGEGMDWLQEQLLPSGSRPSWRDVLAIKNQWLGGFRGPGQHPGSAGILIYMRAMLLRALAQDQVLERYDRFVITRSDFVWLCPHPPLEILAPDRLWFPDGEQYGGLTDRHVVVSREDLETYLSLAEPILTEPHVLLKEMGGRGDWNLERYIAHHLERRNARERVSFFPYVMYSVRPFAGSTSWQAGWYDLRVGHVVKYKTELESAQKYARYIRTRADWLAGAWRDVADQPVRQETFGGKQIRRAVAVGYHSMERLHASARKWMKTGAGRR